MELLELGKSPISDENPANPSLKGPRQAFEHRSNHPGPAVPAEGPSSLMVVNHRNHFETPSEPAQSG